MHTQPRCREVRTPFGSRTAAASGFRHRCGAVGQADSRCPGVGTFVSPSSQAQLEVELGQHPDLLWRSSLVESIDFRFHPREGGLTSATLLQSTSAIDPTWKNRRQALIRFIVGSDALYSIPRDRGPLAPGF